MTVWRPQQVIRVKALGLVWRNGHLLAREIHRDDGSVKGVPIILENIYTHLGSVGHEVTFISDVIFPDSVYAGDGTIAYREDNGTPCTAHWFDLSRLDGGGLPLYPNGLKGALAEQRSCD
ncbi:MAG: DNA mismatch repair protein MutT [Pseudomonadota bacterium]